MTHRARPFCFIVNERRFRNIYSYPASCHFWTQRSASSKRGRVKSSTTQDWRGGARQSNPGPRRGHYKSAGAFFLRWKTTLAKKKKRAALMARSKKRAASSKSDKSNTSWLQLWERTPRQDKDWVGFSRVGNETTFMEWVEAKPPALFESQGQARPSALKRAVCITGFTISNCSKNKGPRRLFWGGMLNPWSTDVASVTKAAAIGLTGSKLSHPIKELKDYPGPRRLFPSADILL